MDKMDLAMYEAFEKLLHEDGHLVKTDIFAFRLGWRECQAAQQSVEPTVEACPPDRHVYYTVFLSYLFCPYCGERLHSG